MIRFRSALAGAFQSYIEFRRAFGYAESTDRFLSKSFDDYLLFFGIQNAHAIDEGVVAHWVHAIPTNMNATKNSKLRFARVFLKFLVRSGLIEGNPATRIPYLRQKPHKPYIYTLREIERLLEAARANQRRTPKRLTGWTMEAMVFLIYACGLRLGEALSLKIADVDFDENTLSLWKTKFHKERIIPFSQAASEKMKTYLARRGRLRSPFFFAGPTGKYDGGTIYARFRLLLVRAGLAKSRGPGPRIHDLRHTFAVHRLYKWYQDGKDPLNKLPLLSVYMGHVNIENTQVYLTITRELLREGDRRFRNGFEAVADGALRRAAGKP
ncbi:MAG: hypothetical protein CO113_09330 [Elusimicrobia bacterium CG_4_9_14_3_um_filter_62_55]|nr:MAG: hypothetical protein COR54_00010 [Elusimicrobia bacterium CG22_combo_CG10-13_8_21_14_all_63_91]PJA18399.1 MAG: hypothetical protein COX66_01230 [Elusimicrobia bacterium CG_4_10_14_0_2_um_filter_63_34]PJB25311.1 MAG: hypothetical protein CO113_09330 [Elusimicrobia bacterium CG_4_9_14_3_um_filter_62_55]